MNVPRFSVERLARIAAEGCFPFKQRLSKTSPQETGDRWTPITLALITTVATFAFAYVGFVLMENQFPSGVFDIWNRWDAVHYMQIAKDGYTADPEFRFLIIWLPLFPALVRIAAFAVQDYVIAGLLVAFLGYLASCVLLYRLVLLDFPERIAKRTVIYLAIFPTAYFFHAAYTESLFLALVVGSFYAARKKNWLFAGVLGGFACLTRITAFGLFPALLVEYLVQKRFRLRDLRPDVLYLLALPAGFAVYLWINYRVLGDPLAFLEIARDRHFKVPSAPWVGAQRVLAAGRTSGPSWFLTIGIAETVAGVGSLIVAIYVALRMRASYAVYMLLSWVNIGFNSWWVSTARYLLPLFPGFIVLALWGERRQVHWTVCLAFLMS